MNNMPLTIFFSAFFTIIYLFLSFRIGYLRGSPVMKLFFKMDKEVSVLKLDRNVRAHGNFSEYVPLFLILLMIMETNNKMSFDYLLTFCLIFLYGRCAHAICFAFFDFSPFLRISGMICTYFSLLVFAITLILSFL